MLDNLNKKRMESKRLHTSKGNTNVFLKPAVLLLLMAGLTDALRAQTATAKKADCMPGEKVNITGTVSCPGETALPADHACEPGGPDPFRIL